MTLEKSNMSNLAYLPNIVTNIVWTIISLISQNFKISCLKHIFENASENK